MLQLADIGDIIFHFGKLLVYMVVNPHPLTADGGPSKEFLSEGFNATKINAYLK